MSGSRAYPLLSISIPLISLLSCHPIWCVSILGPLGIPILGPLGIRVSDLGTLIRKYRIRARARGAATFHMGYLYYEETKECSTTRTGITMIHTPIW